MATSYTEEFRRDAVRIATTSGLTRPQIASDLGVGLSTLTCSIPDDHIDPRRWALFVARSILTEMRDRGRTC